MPISPYPLRSKFHFSSTQSLICTHKHQPLLNISEKSLPTVITNVVSYLEQQVYSLKDNKQYFSPDVWDLNLEALWYKRASWEFLCNTTAQPTPLLPDFWRTRRMYSRTAVNLWESCRALMVTSAVWYMRSLEIRICFFPKPAFTACDDNFGRI